MRCRSCGRKILAGEANAPGRYSKRTVDHLASLDRSDAELFRALCGFAWTGEESSPFVFDIHDDIYRQEGLTFPALSNLEAIGLVQFDTHGGFQFTELPRHVELSYFGTPIRLTFATDTDNSLDVGRVILIRVGLDLTSVCGAEPVAGFADYTVERWMNAGLSPSSILERDRR